MKVDAPDTASIAGVLTSGAEVSVYVGTAPSNPSGYRFDIYGREGTITLGNGSANIGGNTLYLARGREAAAEMPVPDRFKFVPEGTPQGQAYNVAQAYTRFADARQAAGAFDPDFDVAVTRHRLIDAIERSSSEGRSIKL
jgi:predicted dehydrogenase